MMFIKYGYLKNVCLSDYHVALLIFRNKLLICTSILFGVHYISLLKNTCFFFFIKLVVYIVRNTIGRIYAHTHMDKTDNVGMFRRNQVSF